MRILVTGAAGMLGRDLVPILREAHDVVGVDLSDFDVTDPDACRRAVADVRPDAVVHCAAFTDVDACETEAETAFRVNSRAPGFVARACRVVGCRMVHLSTDYVFDGAKDGPYEEGDPTGPLSVYGRSKLAGEEAATRELADMSSLTILRTAWLYGPHGKNFVETILRLAAQRDFLSVVDDQVGCPTYTVDLARAIRAVVEQGAAGVFHAVNAGAVTWNGFAREILRLAGIGKEVRPISTEALGRPARRPRNSVLSTARLARETNYRFRDWQAALAEYMARRRTLQVTPV